jgi:hypothetical protein
MFTSQQKTTFLILCLISLALTAGAAYVWQPSVHLPISAKDGDPVYIYFTPSNNLYHFQGCPHWTPDMKGAPSTYGQLRKLLRERSEHAVPCPRCAEPLLQKISR